MSVLIESQYCLLCLNQEWYDVLDMEFGTVWKQFSHKITLRYHMIYLSTAIGLTPGGSSTVHIYTQTVHRTTQIQTIHRTTLITTEQHK